MPAERIYVQGLIAFQRELRLVDKSWPRELRLANLEAAQVVATATRRSFSSRDGVAPKVAASVKAQAQQRSASVKIGGNRFPYALGSEFGAKTYKQFPPFKKSGYSLYPSIGATREEAMDAYADAIGRLMRRAFPH